MRRITRSPRAWFGLIAWVLMGGVAMAQVNVARTDGVIAVVDSRHRDRWGWDGFHPEFVHDGNTDTSGTRLTCWASDNWEVTHTLALVFPTRMTIGAASMHWGRVQDTPTTPARVVLQGYRADRWVNLADVQKDEPEPVTTVTFEAQPMDAIRLVQRPSDASSNADRRLWVAEFEAIGTPTDPPAAVDASALAATLEAKMRSLRRQEDDERAAPVLDVVMRHRKTRGFMGIIDAEDVKRGRQNAATRPWATNLAQKIIQDADWWVAQSDDTIHGLVPDGNPRAVCPSFERGCPIHGGARYTFTATLEAPFRWKCKRGGEEWYDGVVVKNPTTGEPVTVRDDGHGWLAPEGFPAPGVHYFFVPAYRYFLIGKLFSTPYEPDGGSVYRGGTPVVQLSLAYALTGDSRYAHTCAVMLNRLAEVYRTYDGGVEAPSQRQDGYIGNTFERFLVQNLVLAADLIWDEIEKDTALHTFFAEKGNADYDGDGETTGTDFTFNLQKNLLGYVYEYLHRLMPYMDGDYLMYEMTALAALAHCLGNPEIAAETLESDLGLRVLLTNSWFRDGKYIYDSCAYNVGNAKTPLLIGEWMHGLQAPPRYPDALDVYHHPEYRMAMLFDFLRNIDCDGRVPQIGDGGTRAKTLRLHPPYDPNDERALLRLPEEQDFYLARLRAASGGDLETYRDGKADWWLLFHAQEDGLPRDPGPVATSPVTSHLFDDSGIAILRAGEKPATRQHVCLTLSRGRYGHGHADKLAINIFRYGFDFTGDLGYPSTWTDIKTGGWYGATASHCTVMLDEEGQHGSVTGSLHYYATLPQCDVVEASAEAAYPNASLYRRTVALVRDDRGEPLYTVDIFRVAGARTRDYLFHSPGKPEDLTAVTGDPGATWTKQEKGSLAGEDIEPMTTGGYGFLFDLERAHAENGIRATWSPRSGASQPSRYLLTSRRFRDFTVEFTVVRTGRASGTRERALFAFGVDPDDVGNRRVAWIDASDQLPVGTPVKIRIDVAGPEARVTRDGVLSDRGVDTAGTPGADGVVGFQHYYNYAYEYSDLVLTPKEEDPIRVDFSRPLDGRFWGRIDPTYQTGDGYLLASDYDAVGLYLHMLGAPGREIIKAKGEAPGMRGQSPLEGHVIVRDQVSDAAQGTAFVAVIEAGRRSPRVTELKTIPTATQSSGPFASCDAVALQVTTVDPNGRTRKDYVISTMTETVEHTIQSDAGPITFKGRFGLVTTYGNLPESITLVGGGYLRCGAKGVDLPGSVRGQVIATDIEEDGLVVRIDPGSPPLTKPLIGRKVLVTNPAFLCPAVYTIQGLDPAGPNTWRITLNLPLTIARGVIKDVDPAKGAFATRTPVMKLRVNPGMFDGKRVCALPDGTERRLKHATEAAFALTDPTALGDFAAGGDYVVYDVGPGDRVEILSQGEAR